MLKTDKVKVVEEVKEELKSASGFAVADFKGMTVAEITDFRQKVRESGGYARVVKNRLLKRAFDEIEVQGMEPYLKQNTILIYSKGDIVQSLKVIADFAKDSKKFLLKGGYISGAAYNKDQMIEISKLPGEKQIIASIAGGLNAVVAKFAGALNAIMTKFVGTIEAVENKKKDEA